MLILVKSASQTKTGPKVTVVVVGDCVNCQVMNNPALVRQVMDNPMVQQIMSNPEVMRQMMLSNPQIRDLMEVSGRYLFTYLLCSLFINCYTHSSHCKLVALFPVARSDSRSISRLESVKVIIIIIIRHAPSVHSFSCCQ